MGKGDSILFWDGIWIGSQYLTTLFPRLYLICSLQHSLIMDMGIWNGNYWEWNLQWRRGLFVWEHDLLDNLMILLIATYPV